MESLEFIGIIACGAVVVFWYFQNIRNDGAAERGLLALMEDPEDARRGGRRKSYRIKERLARRPHERPETQGAKTVTEAKPAFRKLSHNARMRARFRRQDEARYKVKDKVAGRKPDAGPSAA